MANIQASPIALRLVSFISITFASGRARRPYNGLVKGEETLGADEPAQRVISLETWCASGRPIRVC
jgi:hypothetical protein